MKGDGWISALRLFQGLMAGLLVLWSLPGAAQAIELELLGDMTSPHGGLGSYQNLLLYSEAFDTGATWVATNTVATANNAVGPENNTGTTTDKTAEKLDFTGATAGTVVELSTTSTVGTTDIYTFSVWLKKDAAWTTGSLIIRLEENGDATDGGEISISQATLSSTVWERYSVTRTFSVAGNSAIKVIIKEAAATDNPIVYTWGAQLEKNSKAMVYVRTAGVTVPQAYGLQVGNNTHVTGNLTVDGNFNQATTGSGTFGSLVVTGTSDMQGAISNSTGSNGGAVYINDTLTTTGTHTFSGTAIDITTGTNEDLVIQPNGTGAAIVSTGTATDDQLKFSPATGGAGRFVGTITSADLTVARTWTLPNVAGTLVTTGDTGSITSTMILDGTILDADVNASAAIAFSKLAALTSANILVGSAGNVATSVTMGGDATISNLGALTIGTGAVTSGKILDGTILDADVNASAAIAGTKIAPNFGSQAVSTTGTLAAGATTVTGTLQANGDLSRRTGDKEIMDSNNGSDTYLVHDTASGGRMRLYVDGVEVARFKP